MKKLLRMKKTDFIKWINSLRSGDFRQGRASMCQLINGTSGEYSYCCLGLLQKVVSKRPPLTQEMPTNKWCLTHGISFAKRDIEPLMAYGNIHHDAFSYLADANDHGIDFKKIAKWLEKNTETY